MADAALLEGAAALRHPGPIPGAGTSRVYRDSSLPRLVSGRPHWLFPGKTLTGGLLDRQQRAISVEHLPGRVAKVEFREVAIQVLLRNVMVRAVNAPL